MRVGVLVGVVLAALTGCGRSTPVRFGEPTLALVPDARDLGAALPGTAVEGVLVLSNPGRVDVDGLRVRLEGDAAFTLDAPPPSMRWGEAVDLRVRFRAELPPRTVTARLVVESAAGRQTAALAATVLDPCDPVACAQPIPPCQNGGRCEAGKCVRPANPGLSCDDGSRCTLGDRCDAQGQCRGTPLACLSPLPTRCEGPDLLVRHESPGTCSDGTCDYVRVETRCPFGCVNNACFDPCANVLCASPPSACHKREGRCVPQLPVGRCEYDFDDGKGCSDGDPCTVADACKQGVCAGAPMVCNSPPPPRCVDPDNSEVHDPQGVCRAGQCEYRRQTQFCSIACLRGRCATSCSVSLLAGNGRQGAQDGPAASASFADPYSLAVDGSGTVFVNDTGNGRIRQIRGGAVSTTPGGSGLSQNHDVALDGAGGLLVGAAGRVLRIVNGSQVVLAGGGPTGFQDGPAPTARFGNEVSVVGTTGTAIFVADADNHRIRRLSAGQVTTWAGVGLPGKVDGPNAVASFDHPHELNFWRGGLVVADAASHSVRLVTSTQTSTVAGTGFPGAVNGPLASARLNNPLDVAVDPEGALYVADSGNHCLRRISPTRVTTFAGICGAPGYLEGDAPRARFNALAGIAVSSNSEFFVSDTNNHRIRVVSCVP